MKIFLIFTFALIILVVLINEIIWQNFIQTL